MASLHLAPQLLSYAPARKSSKSPIFPSVVTKPFSSKFSSIRATVASETPVVDYSSEFSVFPAEACETNGGYSCLASMYPEAKLKPEGSSNKSKTASEPFDREYLDYSDQRSVLLDEACDVLGGEFCQCPF